MEYGLAFLVLAMLVAVLVALPLRPGAEPDRAYDQQRAELEAAKEAKYREIRDAELDHQMGKLSDAEHRELDRELRAEAIVILTELDRLT